MRCSFGWMPGTLGPTTPPWPRAISPASPPC